MSRAPEGPREGAELGWSLAGHTGHLGLERPVLCRTIPCAQCGSDRPAQESALGLRCASRITVSYFQAQIVIAQENKRTFPGHFGPLWLGSGFG